MFVGESELMFAYANPATIRRSGNVIRMWGLYDFKTVQQNPVAGRPFSSERTQVEYDCKGERSRILYLSWHSGRMAGGDVVYDELGPDRWIPVAPGSIMRLLWTFACSERPAAGEWLRLAEYDAEVIYVDSGPFFRTGNTVRMWELRDFKTAQSSLAGPFLSHRAEVEYDCRGNRWRWFREVAHSGQMGGGDVVFDVSGLGEWKPVAPGSYADAVLKFVCSRT